MILKIGTIFNFFLNLTLFTAVTILLSLTVFLNNITKSLPENYKDLDDVPLISMQETKFSLN